MYVKMRATYYGRPKVELNIDLKPKQKLMTNPFTPDKLLSTGEATDWDLANYLYTELTGAGERAHILYLERGAGPCVTYCLCKKSHLKWYWFCWEDGKIIKTYGPFSSLVKVVAECKAYFMSQYQNKATTVKLSPTGIESGFIDQGETNETFLTKMRKWDIAPR